MSQFEFALALLSLPAAYDTRWPWGELGWAALALAVVSAVGVAALAARAARAS